VLDWPDLADDAAGVPSDSTVELDGWMAPVQAAERHGYFLLTPEPVCCWSCLPADPSRCVEVLAREPLALSSCPVRLRGRWHRLAADDPAGWRWQLRDAQIITMLPRPDDGHGISRRLVLAAAPLFYPTLAAAQGPSELPRPPEAPGRAQHLERARQLIAQTVTVDIHSHAGRILGIERVANNGAFSPVAAPMREGGMALVCLAMVADTPVIRLLPERRLAAARNPEPGELYTWGRRAFERVVDLVRSQQLLTVTNAATLADARRRGPAVVIAAEGADFLEGRIERLQEAYATWRLRHLQLTHYRINELGDIQTEAPQHGGLTDFGVEVVRACNRLGIVVDVAHGTLDLVKRAASVTTKPLVLSHTSLSAKPAARSRLVSADHARIVARTGGVIGIWPPTTIFADMAAYAGGIARMVDAVGVDHVGIGSDMLGLLSPAAFDSYRQLPDLAAALLAIGFKPDEAGKILGGSYARVFTATTG
ncbi:MAG TPA: membrane dipeptidase, partial [Vineibacter sp.]|nr:membrane dipeptidase [Vineibacter sp.]